MVTIKDVGKLAGVSFKTVSRVLNNDPAVREPTRQRVLEAADALGYRPNAAARGLRQRRTHTIGFISDEIGSTPFTGLSLQGAQDAAWDNNLLLLSINTAKLSSRKEAAVDMLLYRQVEGIIYAAMYHREVVPPEAIRSVPTVLLDCYMADQSLPSVVPDEYLGGYTATEHLLDKGFRRIGMINHTEAQAAATGRLSGYRQALADRDISADEAWVVEDLARIDGGFRATLKLLESTPDIEAIFCFNDRMAMGAYQALDELDRSIPNDIAIIGFDNEPNLGEWLRPPLTTLELPHYAMGQWAIVSLLGMMTNPQLEQQPIQARLACSLIQRGSA